MRTIRRQARVNEDHTLVVHLPDDVQEESLAEVIVRVPPVEACERGFGRPLASFLASLAGSRRRILGRAEIDRLLAIERGSWD